MSEKDGGPAFPAPPFTVLKDDLVATVAPGMSLRDWFAGQALQSTQWDEWSIDVEDGQTMEQRLAESCYAIADAMLTERERKP